MRARRLKRGRGVLGVWLLCLVSGPVSAAAIGMPERSDRIGLGLGYARLTVEDPAGASAAEWVVRPLNVVYTQPASGPYRYWAEAFYQDAVLPASTTDIGQRVRQLGLRASFQRRLGVPTVGSSWLGAGVQLARERFENRHRLDGAGFLAQSYPQRSEFIPALLLNYIVEAGLNGWDMAVKLEQSLPAGDGSREFSLSVIVLFGL